MRSRHAQAGFVIPARCECMQAEQLRTRRPSIVQAYKLLPVTEQGSQQRVNGMNKDKLTKYISLSSLYH